MTKQSEHSTGNHCNNDVSRINISHATGLYPVIIGHQILTRLPEFLPSSLAGARYCVISDRRVAWHYLNPLKKAMTQAGIDEVSSILFQPGERSKSMATFTRFLNHLCSIGMSRNDFIIALGGGVTGDLAGFTAAAFMRGIPFIQIPTTLLSQADSSIGGKTGINLAAGKNLAGAFHFPTLVLTDIATLDTLPPRQLANGLAEIIKIALIADADLFQFLLENADRILDPNHRSILEKVLIRACQLKADIVEQDEREKGIRTWLNLGHTFGHAIEKTVGFGKTLHGEAVGLGMIAALAYAESVEICDSDLRQQLVTLLETVGLPVKQPDLDIDMVISAMTVDKKNVSGINRLVLPEEPGKVIVHANPDPIMLKRALQAVT